VIAAADAMMGDDWALLLYSPYEDSVEKAWLVSQRKHFPSKGKGKGGKKGQPDVEEDSPHQYRFFVLDEALQVKPVESYRTWIIVGTCAFAHYCSVHNLTACNNFTMCRCEALSGF
jgi:hypothetical protein